MLLLADDVLNGAKIKVIGVGGGGGNVINTMIDSGLKYVEFIVANTDQQALENNKAAFKVQIGRQTTKGLGAGGNPDVGKESAIEDEEAMRNILAGADMVFITCGMGGGTGTGAAPVIARIAKEMGILTVGVVTKPFTFEGKKRQKLAENGIKEIRKNVDTLIIIPNQRLVDIIGEDTSFIDGFKKVDEVLFYAIKGITDLINQHGHINIDFADVKTVMKDKGLALMGIGRSRGPNRAQEAAIQAISSPLLENISITGATGIIISIAAGPKLAMREVDEATTYITDAADENADIKFGLLVDSSLGDDVIVSVIATGFKNIEEDTQSTKLSAFQNHRKDLNLKKDSSREDYAPPFSARKYFEKNDNATPRSIRADSESNLDVPTYLRNRR